jgi:hypothetical protein
MAANYRPYEPQNTLKPVGTGIWIVDGPVVQWGYMGWRFPFPTRMTIIRLADGSLWIHSPTAPDEELLAKVDALGPVAHLVSPNAIHHISIGAWAKRYPEAKTWASPGVRRRSPVDFTDDLENTPPTDWADVIDQRIAEGSPALKEVIFFHRPSRTMILADMIENFEPDRIDRPWFRRLAGLTGILAPDGGAPRDLRLTYLAGHAKLKTTVGWMLDCHPEKVVIAHGKWFEEDGEAEIRRAFSWVRGIG